MKKERQKQIRALFHLFLCKLWIFFSNFYLHFYCWYIFVSFAQPISGQRSNPIFPKNTWVPHALGAPRGHKLETPPAKWDHHWLTHIWPISLFHTPWKHQKTKGPAAFPGGHKTRRLTRKGSSGKIKTIKDLLQVKKTNK